MDDHQIIGTGGLILACYAFLYFRAAAIVARARDNAINPFQVKRVILECLGAVLRRARGYITFTTSMDWSRVLKLDPRTATFADVEAAGTRILRNMRQRRWCYPPSQRHVILRLMAQAFVYLEERRSREEWVRRATEWARKSRATGQQWAAAHRRPPSGWRSVLGLASEERDVAVIKKAYRTRALKAHPDRGGSDAEMAKLNTAFAQAREELEFV
jgi:hypothetical protein